MKFQRTFACGLVRRTAGAALVLWTCGLPAQEPATNAPVANGSAAKVEAPAPAVPSRHEYAHFAPINDRNIFNPNRTRRSRYNAAEEKPPEPKIDIIGLTGTLSYQQGNVAFFDSTAGEFRKAARVGEQIAGYTLKDIAPNSVSLELEGQPLQLKVGQQLRRQDDGPWEVTTGEAISASSGGSGRSSRSSRRDGEGYSSGRASRATSDESGPNSSTSSAAAAASGEGPSEALKRLLEQRRKEQSQ